MFKIYQEQDYLSEDGKFITTPKIDTCTEFSIGFAIVLLGLILPMIGVVYGL